MINLPERMILPCGNAGVLNPDKYSYTCNYCHQVIGSPDEPTTCKQKREGTEPYKNDYWMNINDDEHSRD